MGAQSVTTATAAIPSAADGVSLTPSGSAWSSSSYVQLTAALGTAGVLAGIVVRNSNTADMEAEIDIATGGAGSEVVIATFRCHWQSILGLSGPPICALPIPIDAIANGARVAARIRLGTTNATAWNITAVYLVKPITGTLQTTTKVLKAVPSAAAAIAVAASATAWANGSWGQVLASTSAAIVVVAVVVWCSGANATLQYELDLGTGGSGSEVVVTTLRGIHTNNASCAGPHYVVLEIPLDNIAISTRIAIRARIGSASSGASLNGALNYVEKPL